MRKLQEAVERRSAIVKAGETWSKRLEKKYPPTPQS
jgi:hypothetical protein